MTTAEPLRLWQLPGWGSAIVEAQLALYGLRHELVTPEGDEEAIRAAILTVNPVGQLPVLELPDGQVMTESAAMTLHLADLARCDALVPGPDAPERAAFLRWLVYIVANIYPCFTFADVPTRYVSAREAEAFKARVTDRSKDLWRIVEDAATAAGGPWILGQRFSALDIYIAVMVHWRPRQDWFRRNTPALSRIAAATAARPDLAAVFHRNFG